MIRSPRCGAYSSQAYGDGVGLPEMFPSSIYVEGNAKFGSIPFHQIIAGRYSVLRELFASSSTVLVNAVPQVPSVELDVERWHSPLQIERESHLRHGLSSDCQVETVRIRRVSKQVA